MAHFRLLTTSALIGLLVSVAALQFDESSGLILKMQDQSRQATNSTPSTTPDIMAGGGPVVAFLRAFQSGSTFFGGRGFDDLVHQMNAFIATASRLIAPAGLDAEQEEQVVSLESLAQLVLQLEAWHKRASSKVGPLNAPRQDANSTGNPLDTWPDYLEPLLATTRELAVQMANAERQASDFNRNWRGILMTVNRVLRAGLEAERSDASTTNVIDYGSSMINMFGEVNRQVSQALEQN